MTIEKTCRICGETKGVYAFGKKADTRDGYDHRCKDCRRAKGGHTKRKPKDYPFTPASWLEAFGEVADITVDGVPTTMDEAKGMAREALRRPATGTKAKLQARRRLERFDELCGEAEARAMTKAAQWTEFRLSPNRPWDTVRIDPNYIDHVADVIARRADDEMTHRLPILQGGTDQKHRKCDNGGFETTSNTKDRGFLLVGFDEQFRGENGEYLI